MKKLLNLFVLSTFMLVSACTDGVMPAPKTPAQAIFQLESGYAAALKYELAYAQLPPCTGEVVQACSKIGVVRTVKRASDVAWTAIKTAQNVVRTPGYGSNTAVTALTSATEALNAYLEITNTLKLN